MWRFALYLLLFTLWFLPPAEAQSPLQKTYYPYAISVESNYGFIIPHHYYINYLIKSHIGSFNAEWLQGTNGSKQWHHFRHFPALGGGIYFANLGNPEILGNVWAIYGKIEMPVTTKMAYSINAGISYLSKTFIPVTNNLNTCISSHLNVYFQLAFLYHFSLSEHWIIFPKLSLTHYSNGNASQPNTGLNVASAGIGIRYFYKNKQSIIPFEKAAPEINSSPIEIYIIPSAGLKATTKEKNAHFLVADIETSICYRLSHTTGINAGIDYFYDQSVKSLLRFVPNQTYRASDAHQIGIHLGYEPLWGQTSIAIQMGYFIYDNLNLEGRYYHRVALNHRFKRHIIGGIALKTFFFKAEHIEWRIGYVF